MSTVQAVPFIRDDVAIALLEGQFYRIVWVVHVIQEQCLLPNDNTDLKNITFICER